MTTATAKKPSRKGVPKAAFAQPEANLPSAKVPVAGKNGLRRYSEPTADYCASVLVGTDDGREFAAEEIALSTSISAGLPADDITEFNAEKAKVQQAMATGRTDAAALRRVLAVFRKWRATPEGSKAFDASIKILAEKVRAAAVTLKVHPLDLIEMGQALNRPVDSWGTAWLQSLRRLRPSFVRSNINVIAHVGRALSALGLKLQTDGMAGGFVAGKASPWRPEQTRFCTGAEVTKIVYEVPVKWNEKGEPTEWAEGVHIVAAKRAYDAAANAGEYQALLQRTVAGRVWLCFDPRSGHLYLGTDREPTKALFVVDRKDAFTAKLENAAGDHVTGFVI